MGKLKFRHEILASFFLPAAIAATGVIFCTLSTTAFYSPKLLVLRLFLVIGGCVLGAGWIAGRAIRWSDPTVPVLAAIFAGIVCLSALESGIPLMSLPKTFEYLTFAGFLTLCWLFQTDDAGLKIAGVCFDGLACFLIAYGFVQHFGLDPISWSPGGKRIFSFIGNADTFGSLLAVLATMSAVGFMRKPGWARLILICAELAALFWTFTRGPFLALFAAGLATIAFIAAFRPLRPALPRAGITCAAALAIFSLLFLCSRHGAESARFIPSTWKTAHDIVARGYLFQKGLEVLSQHPWKGVGPGNFSYAYLPFRYNDPPFYRTRLAMAESTHNAFLDVFTETGLPGGAVFLALWLTAMMRHFWRLKDAQEENAFDHLFILAPLVTAFVSLQFVYPDVTMTALAAFLLGATLPGKEERKTLKPARPLAAALGALVILACVGGGIYAVRSAAGDLWAGIGQRAMDAREFPRAIRSLNAAQRFAPWNPAIYQQLGKLYEIAVNPGYALRYYSKAILLQGDNPYLWADLGRLAGINRWKHLMVKAYAEATERDPYNPFFQHDAAATASQSGYFHLSLLYSREALLLDPDNPSNGYLYALSLFETGRKNEAEAEISRETEKFPHDPDLTHLAKQITR